MTLSLSNLPLSTHQPRRQYHQHLSFRLTQKETHDASLGLEGSTTNKHKKVTAANETNKQENQDIFQNF